MALGRTAWRSAVEEPNGGPTASVAAGASWLSPGRPTAEAEPALPAWQHDPADVDGEARIRAPSEERVRLRSVLSGGGLSGLKQLQIADVTALVIPGSAPELAGAAVAALLIAAGHDGAWRRDWTDPRTAAQARRITDELASVFDRDQHRHDQELPLEP